MRNGKNIGGQVPMWPLTPLSSRLGESGVHANNDCRFQS